MDISYKNICRISFPVLLSLLVEQVIGITDTVFLGHVGDGKVELGASAIAGVCYLILFVIGSGFGVGLQVLIARLNGENEQRQISATLATGLYFLAALAVVIIGFSHLLFPYILKSAIQSEAIYIAALKYLDWRIYGLLFSFIIIAFRAYYVGITKTRFLTINSIAMVLVNVLCNYVLVFGHWGFPQLGIEGAAIGSTIAELTAAMLFIVYYQATAKSSLFVKITNLRQQWLNLRRILKLSIWTMIQSFVSLSTWLLFFIVIERLGEVPLAISNIVRSISAIPFIIIQAFASTGSSLVSNLIGEGRQDMVMRLCKKIIVICYVVCVPLLIVSFAIPDVLLGFYTSNQVLIDGAVAPFLVMFTSYFIAVPSAVFYCAIMGTGDTLMTLKVGLIALTIYTLYMLLVAYIAPNVTLLWTSEHIYAIVVLILSMTYMLRGNWRQRRI